MNPNQNQQSRDQRQQQPAPAPAFDGVTYYLIVADDPDREMALKYLEGKQIKPTRHCRIVTELNVERLTEQHRVIALYRNTRGDRNSVSTVQGDDGRNRRVLEATHAPIQETEPIAIADCWVKGNASVDDILDGMLSDGELNTRKFLGELGKRIVPAVVSFHPDRGEPLRIKYA